MQLDSHLPQCSTDKEPLASDIDRVALLQHVCASSQLRTRAALELIDKFEFHPSGTPAEYAGIGCQAYSELLKNPWLHDNAEYFSSRIFCRLNDRVPQYKDALQLTRVLSGHSQNSGRVSRAAFDHHADIFIRLPGNDLERKMEELLEICDMQRLYAARLCQLISADQLKELASHPQLELWGAAQQLAMAAMPELAGEALQPSPTGEDVAEPTPPATSTIPLQIQQSATIRFFPTLMHVFVGPLSAFWTQNAERSAQSWLQFSKSLLHQAFLRLEGTYGSLCPALYQVRGQPSAAHGCAERLALSVVAGLDLFWSLQTKDAAMHLIIDKYFTRLSTEVASEHSPTFEPLRPMFPVFECIGTHHLVASRGKANPRDGRPDRGRGRKPETIARQEPLVPHDAAA